MSGSLKSLSRALDAVLSSETSDDLDSAAAEAVAAFIEHESPIDTAYSSRLHDELIRLHNLHVKDNLHKESVFLGYLRDLSSCIINIENLKVWFDYYRNPAVDSAGHSRDIVQASVDFLLSVLSLPAVMATSSEKQEPILKEYQNNSDTIARWLLDIYLDCSSEWKFERNQSNNGDITVEEERHRYIRMNAKNILVAYGMKCVKPFLTILNDKFVLRQFRMEVLVLLSIYVSRQPAYLHLVEETPLLGSLQLCLLYDISASLLTVCATTLAMILPHIPSYMAKNLKRLLAIYGRLCSWRRDSPIEQEPQELDISLDNSLLSDEGATSVAGKWQVQDHIFQVDDNIKPKATYLFTILYGLFPTNLIAFVQSPTAFLETKGFSTFPDFWEKNTITAVSRAYSSEFTLNPALLSYSSREELSDLKRFAMMGSVTDISSYCLQFYSPLRHAKPRHIERNLDLPFDDMDGFQDDLSGDPSEKQESRAVSDTDQKPLSPPTAKVSSPSQVLTQSPVLQDIDTLLKEHKQLYSQSERSAAKLENALTSIPETIDLANDTNTHNSKGLRRLSIDQSPLQLAQSSPLLPPQSALSPPQVSAVNVVSPSLEPVASLSSTSSSAPSGRRKSSGSTIRRGSFDSITSSAVDLQVTDLKSQLAYYQRELLLIKNELEFAMFIEYHSQYRYRRLKEQVAKEAVSSERFMSILENNKALKARVSSLVAELEKTRARMQSYREGVMSYEAQLVSKNKELRARVKELSESAEKYGNEEGEVKSWTTELEKSCASQEKKISELELEIENLEANADVSQSYSEVVVKLSKEISDLKQQYLGISVTSNGADDADDGDDGDDDEGDLRKSNKLPTLEEYEKVLQQLEELKSFKESADHDIQVIEDNHERAMAEMRETIKFYENQEREGATVEVSAKIDNLKKIFEARYLELKATYEALATKHTGLVKQYQNKIIEFETLQAKIDEPVLVKKSILQHDDMSSQSDEASRAGSSSNTSTIRMLVRQPTEQRIRGRGGVQNMGTKDVNGKKKQQPPRQNFRGLNM